MRPWKGNQGRYGLWGLTGEHGVGLEAQIWGPRPLPIPASATLAHTCPCLIQSPQGPQEDSFPSPHRQWPCQLLPLM